MVDRRPRKPRRNRSAGRSIEAKDPTTLTLVRWPTTAGWRFETSTESSDPMSTPRYERTAPRICSLVKVTCQAALRFGAGWLTAMSHGSGTGVRYGSLGEHWTAPLTTMALFSQQPIAFEYPPFDDAK